MNSCDRGLVENEQHKKMKSIVVEENEEHKKMKSIVVEEQEEEEGSESETSFVDLDEDVLQNVLNRVDLVTLGRAACVNKLWLRAARPPWWPILTSHFLRSGGYGRFEEEGSESETSFVDLNEDVLHNVLKRVDVVTLGRAACVNKLWRTAAQDERLWGPIVTRHFLRSGGYGRFDVFRKEVAKFGGFCRFHSLRLWPLSKPPPSDFYSIDPTVFKIQPFSEIASTSSKMG